MPKQPAIPSLRDAMKQKVTRREQFLTEMEAVVPWGRLLALIAPHYPMARPRCGRPPMRRFAGIELGDDRIPDETTILNFRHLLERHGLTQAIFADVNAHLADKGINLRSAPWSMPRSSTRHPRPRTRPRRAIPRCHRQRGNDWYFGMKAQIGVDVDSGVTHSLEISTAKLHDSQVWNELLHGEETSVWADKGYVSAEREAAFKGPGKIWGVMRKARKGEPLQPLGARINRSLAECRAQIFTLFALANLFLARRRRVA